MSVQTIFKVLIGVTVIIVVGTLMVELIGSIIISNELRISLRRSALQACDFYNQESYRTTTSDNKVMANSDLKVGYRDTDGSIKYLDYGNFYTGTDTQSVFDNLYTNNQSSVRNALTYSGNTDDWDKFDRLNSMNVNSGGNWGDNCITPANLGMVYFDKAVLTKMIKWNFTNTLTIGEVNSYTHICDNVGKFSNDGKVYIKKSGFLIDINNLQVTNITYSRYDLNNSTDRNKVTDIIGGQYSQWKSGKVRVAQVKVSVPIKFEGVTGLMDKVVSRDAASVDGLDSSGGADLSQSWNSSSKTGKIGSPTATSGSGAVGKHLQGNIYYYTIVGDDN